MPEDGLRPARHVVRQHRRADRELVAACGVHRAAGRPTRAAGRRRRRRCRRREAERHDRRVPRHAVDRVARPGGRTGPAAREEAGAPRRGSDFRWLMMSDVCKHCTHAACLDVCPTGALFRTEFGTVVVQEDICNGCGYCIPACPYGVIDQRQGDGRAWKCTLCYDRIGDGLTPACAQACPTQSIQYGPLDELRERAAARVDALHAAGVSRGPALRSRPERRGRRRRRVLPAARRARGVRPAAGPGRDHAGPAGHVAAGRVGPR